MSRHKLKNAPLQEVVFELFWELPLLSSGQPSDPGFDFAQGKFAARMEEGHFPIKKRLIPEDLPFKLLPGLYFQFWRDEQTWPVVQFGPGLVTVNDTEKNYTWKDNFVSNILFAINSLQHSYERGLNIKLARLKYIDAVEFDPNAESAADFAARNLNIQLQNLFQAKGILRDVNIVQTFDLEQETVLRLHVGNGFLNHTEKPAIVWVTEIEASSLTFDNLFPWLEYAHDIVSKTFINMLNPEFYASFDR